MLGALHNALVLADSWDWHHGDWGGGWWVMMGLGMILFWALVIALVVWLVRGGLGRGDGAAHGKESALEILERRLANGEISVEEYETRRRVLIGK